MRPYAIVSLKHWNPSAGTRAAHYLCDRINRLGGRAFMLYVDDPVGGYAKSPQDLNLPPQSSLTLAAQHDAIVVATDYVKSDSERTVHWFLGPPAHVVEFGIGATNGDFTWCEPRAQKSAIYNNLKRLFVGDIYEPFFYPRSATTVCFTPRRGVAVYLGKGTIDWALVPKDAFVIDGSWPRTREALADLLRSVELVMSFDPFSSLNLEATLCGCPVRVHETPKYTRAMVEAFLSHHGTRGYAWSDDEIPQAREQAKGVYEAFRAFRRETAGDVPYFVESTQRRFP